LALAALALVVFGAYDSYAKSAHRVLTPTTVVIIHVKSANIYVSMRLVWMAFRKHLRSLQQNKKYMNAFREQT